MALIFSFVFPTVVGSNAFGPYANTPHALLHDVEDTFADARCITVVRGTKSQSQRSSPLWLPTIDLDAFEVEGKVLTESGRQCPNHILDFSTGSDLEQFLSESGSSLRKRGANYVIIVHEKVNAEDVFMLPLMNRLLHVVLLDESSPSVYLAYEKPATECAMADGLKPFDAWTPERTSKIRRPLFNPRIMDHVGCKHFKASAFHYPPYTTVEKAADGVTDVYGGMEYHIFSSIAHRLGFDYTVAPPVICCTWGGKPIADETGHVVNYTGVVGDLHNNFVDIAWTNLYYKGGRLDIIDLTMANSFREAGFLIQKPPPLPLWTATFQPFPVNLWLAFLATMIGCSFFITTYMRLSGEGNDILLYILVACAAFFDRPSDEFQGVKSGGLRLFLVIFLLNLEVITTVYKSAFISVLTYPITPAPINSLEEVVASDLRIQSLGRFCEAEGSPNPLLIALMPRFSSIDVEQVIIDDVLAGKSARLSSLLFLDYHRRSRMTNKHGETTGHILPPIHSWMTGFGVQKDSIYQQEFSEKIQRLSESGLDLKWRDDEMAKAARLYEAGKRGIRLDVALVLEQLQSAFILLFFGIIASAAALAIERARYATESAKDQESFRRRFIAEIPLVY